MDGFITYYCLGAKEEKANERFMDTCECKVNNIWFCWTEASTQIRLYFHYIIMYENIVILLSRPIWMNAVTNK